MLGAERAAFADRRPTERNITMARQYEKQFKLDAVKYCKEHPNLTTKACAQNLKIPYDTLSGWLRNAELQGENAFRGSGNYSSDEAKEIARLKRELRDTQDALEILKKAIGILGE